MEINNREPNYTIVNVSNVGSRMTNDRLRTLFEKYGRITSYKIMNESDEVWRRFGYVAFEDSDAAEDAAIELNGHKIDGERRIKVRIRRKTESEKIRKKRDWEGKYNAEAATSVAVEATSSVVKTPKKKSEEPNNCVHVSNLDKTVDSSDLREAFRSYGTILYAKIIRDAQGSKGYGFVTFTSIDGAQKAINGMEGRLIGSQPIRVGFSRGKDKMADNLPRMFGMHRREGERSADNRHTEISQGRRTMYDSDYQDILDDDFLHSIRGHGVHTISSDDDMY